MTVPPDADPVLESLLDELRAVIATANALEHPVYPASPARIAEVEQRAAQLRAEIQARRHELSAR